MASPPKACKYGCGLMLTWNNEGRFFFEANSGTQHDRVRCEGIRNGTVVKPSGVSTGPVSTPVGQSTFQTKDDKISAFAERKCIALEGILNQLNRQNNIYEAIYRDQLRDATSKAEFINPASGE